MKLNRKEIVRFLQLCITNSFSSNYKIFFEVSASKNSSITPDGFAGKYHLDCVLLESWRKSSKNPFRTHCIEIKSCKADFKSDKKWQNYIGRTDELSFLALPGVINPEDLPKGIGLFVPSCSSSCGDTATCLNRIKNTKSQKVSTEARYDTMYGLAINTRRYNRKDWTEKDDEEREKLSEKYLEKAWKKKLKQGVLGI